MVTCVVPGVPPVIVAPLAMRFVAVEIAPEALINCARSEFASTIPP